MNPPLPPVIRSVGELVKQNEIKWFIEANGSLTIRGRAAEEGSLLKYYNTTKLQVYNCMTDDMYVFSDVYDLFAIDFLLKVFFLPHISTPNIHKEY